MTNQVSHHHPRQAVDSPTLSIVVPAMNEHGNLCHLCQEVTKYLRQLDLPWELIVVDDGSTDATWRTISDLHAADNRIKGLRLSRNFGHQYALLAGLQHALGDAVISMDADMQHPPHLIPTLVESWNQGYQIVNTVRQDAAVLPWFKRFTSRAFYSIFSYLSGVSLQSGMADYRLLDRQVVRDIQKFDEEGLFLRGIVQWIGFSSITIDYRSAARHSGKTKYTLHKMLRFAWHGVSSFSIVPLRIGVLLGFAASGLSFLGVLYAIYTKLIAGAAVPGWASSVAIMSFLFGLLFMLLGLMGEYLGRILVEVRHRPRYLIQDSLGVKWRSHNGNPAKPT